LLMHLCRRRKSLNPTNNMKVDGRNLGFRLFRPTSKAFPWKSHPATAG
jgi:hypothetical protein